MEVGTVAASPAGHDAPGGTRHCSGPDRAYTVGYPAGWHTVEDGPVPCRFFHPEPFRLPEGTEADWVAVRVAMAPIPFEEIVGSERDRLAGAILSWRVDDIAGRRAVRTVSASSGTGLLPAGTRVLTWYVDAGPATLVGTTSDASAGTFENNAEVLDRMVASAEVRSLVGTDVR